MSNLSHSAYIALGANLGERAQALSSALERLRAHTDIRVERVSRFYPTEPVGGPPGQPKFLNACAGLRTSLSPRALLDLLLGIEQSLGRVRTAERNERNEPRTIDLDLLLYDDLILSEPGLEIPHPRMHERLFVLEPLAEIAGQLVHPKLGKSIGELRTLP